ncbi:M48 family metallopeptidase [Rossellomorea aquimaris]|uniref:M48 family metallopeptidase n=1 Tax=Rossellomorea aquimaris TaxID=189382 RepID=UPI001CD55407|nr:SprT family zinc-dependent metalloprotease [Rossellomorea aquimaris]MCA1055816.1 M48 family metallopeptidase [Rossellomorea aquimaris]
MIHTFAGDTLHFQLRYKNRTSIGIYFDRFGTIEVQAPRGTSDETVLRLLEEKWDVIQERLQEVKRRMDGPEEKVYEEGEPFLYLGGSFPIRIDEDATVTQDRVVFDGKTLRIKVKTLDDDKVQQALKRFYYQKCKALVEKSVAAHQKNFKMKPRSIRISDSQTTWGTCDSNRQLTFNWKLAMAPQEVIDYVVIHEMCHMVHLNHDRSFWRLVGKLMPDYKEKEKWLASSSWKMTI